MAEEKLPPQAPEAELAVIGSMLIEREGALVASRLLKPGDFYMERNRALFEVMAGMLDEPGTSALDAVTVSSRLRELKLYKELGGAAYLLDAAAKTVTAAHVEHYAKFVRRASLDRQIYAQLGRTNAERTRENVTKLGALIQEREGLVSYDALDFEQDLNEAIERLLERMPAGYLSGFPSLDDLVTNFQPGDLGTIGARTAGGKTALMTRMAVNLALAGVPTTIQTTEMDTLQMLLRILPMMTGIPAATFRQRRLSSDQLQVIIEVAGSKLSRLPLRIVAKPRLSIEDVRAITHQTRAKVVFVDYLQRCRFPKADNRAYAVGEFMAEFKTFLSEAGVLGFIGCQLDRGMDKNKSAAPQLADLKDSSSIEHESTHVLLMWRPNRNELKGPPPDEGCVGLEGILAKNRFGPAPRTLNLQLKSELVEVCERLANERPQQEELPV